MLLPEPKHNAFPFGDPDTIGVERGIAELRAARPVVVVDEQERYLALPLDGLDSERLSAFMQGCAPAVPRLAITARRAKAIGLDAAGPVTLSVSRLGLDALHSLAWEMRDGNKLDATPAAPALHAALDLAKLAQRLPAMLTVDADAADAGFDPAPICVSAAAVSRFRRIASKSLKIVGEAKVPIADGVQSRFVVFRNEIGNDTVAIVVGKPNFAEPVRVRLHSACLTGDVFGSRRCDCGDQLRLALRELVAGGGGIILYLDQEGRGVGLANKMRAYTLQDAGVDTVDANILLGFDDDERDYEPAGKMLQMLGCRRVQLFTNNPAKVSALASAGIEISERKPLVGPVNGDNRRYLTAKATRNGHSLGHLLESLGAPGEPTLVAAEEAAVAPPGEA